MKKILTLILALCAVLSLTACGGKTVTIYILETEQIYMADGSLYKTATCHYEEGWQEKDSFTVTVTGNADVSGDLNTIVYSERKIVMEDSAGVIGETNYDEKGQTVMTVIYFADGGRQEVIYTRDSKGRVVTEVAKNYQSETAEPVTMTVNYTYTETETGSTATYSVGLTTYVEEYDKNGQKIAVVLRQMNGYELSRMEMTYDDNGNMVRRVDYSDGKKSMETRCTYKAVEVSAKTAARLPQLKQGK